MLHLLVDTSTWVDLSKRRDGQRWIVALRVLIHQGEVELLVPSLVIDEYERNRERVQASMTASVAQRFKLIRQDLDDYGGTDTESALQTVEDLARHAPLIGAMATRNFDEVLELLRAGRTVEPTEEDHRAVIERGMAKQAPFHRSRNSVADALLIEVYATAAKGADLPRDPHAFVTSNSEDFSLANGDKRLPHPDVEGAFAATGSTYALGVDGLNGVLLEHFGEELRDLFAENDFAEEPRLLDEIQEAERRFFDRIWYHRSLQHEYRLEEAGDQAAIKNLSAIAGPGRTRVEETYPEPGELGPYSDFELGMLNGKLSALRWVLGSEWDFLDTEVGRTRARSTEPAQSSPNSDTESAPSIAESHRWPSHTALLIIGPGCATAWHPKVACRKRIPQRDRQAGRCAAPLRPIAAALRRRRARGRSSGKAAVTRRRARRLLVGDCASRPNSRCCLLTGRAARDS